MSSSPSYLLDTNITAYILSGGSKSARLLLQTTLEVAPVAISAVTEAEIRFGLSLKPGAVRLRDAVEKFLQTIEIRAWDSGAARGYASLRTQLKRSGKSLSTADLMIAAHAIAAGAILVTHDKAFLHAAPPLSIADWATDVG